MLTKRNQVKLTLHSKLHFVALTQQTWRPFIRNTTLIIQSQYYNYQPQECVPITCNMTNTNTIHCQYRPYSESINNVTSEQLRKAYAILGLHTSASDTEIKQAYQRYVKLYHPDLWHTSTHPNSGCSTKNGNEEFMINGNHQKNEERVNNDKLIEPEVVQDEDSNIRDRMAAGNEAYQLLRRISFLQRQKILSRTSILNESQSNNYYTNNSYDASAPIMNNGSSFHCTPEEYERAQRVYYGEARAIRKKTNISNSSYEFKKKKESWSENSIHASMSTREFNMFMNASKNNENNNERQEQPENNEHQSSSTKATSVSKTNKVGRREVQSIMFYWFLLERLKSLKQWIEDTYTQIVNPHHVTTEAKKHLKHTWHKLENKFDTNKTAHNGQCKESANKSEQGNKTHSPFFSLHYMTVDPHNLHRLHNLHSREPSDKETFTNTNTRKTNLPFDKTEPCRLRYVLADGIPQIVREQLVTTSTTRTSPHVASSTSTPSQNGLPQRLLLFFELVTPDTILAFFKRMHRYVHRTILDKPVIFPSWPTSVCYRHIVLYASALAMSCIGFILLDSFVSAIDHTTSIPREEEEYHSEQELAATTTKMEPTWKCFFSSLSKLKKTFASTKK